MIMRANRNYKGSFVGVVCGLLVRKTYKPHIISTKGLLLLLIPQWWAIHKVAWLYGQQVSSMIRRSVLLRQRGADNHLAKSKKALRVA